MSLGMEGDASAASRLRISASCRLSSSSDQQETNPAGNRSRAMAGCTCRQGPDSALSSPVQCGAPWLRL